MNNLKRQLLNMVKQMKEYVDNAVNNGSIPPESDDSYTNEEIDNMINGILNNTTYTDKEISDMVDQILNPTESTN